MSSSFTQTVPAGAILRGVGPATQGLTLRVHSAQPIGAPALRGDFTLLSEDAAHVNVMETHLGDDVSHNAFVAVQSAIPKTGERGNFEALHATLVGAVGADAQRINIVNNNLFGRNVWEVIGGREGDLLREDAKFEPQNENEENYKRQKLLDAACADVWDRETTETTPNKRLKDLYPEGTPIMFRRLEGTSFDPKGGGNGMTVKETIPYRDVTDTKKAPIMKALEDVSKHIQETGQITNFTLSDMPILRVNEKAANTYNAILPYEVFWWFEKNTQAFNETTKKAMGSYEFFAKRRE